jgi:hypothetical protein
MSRMTWKRAFKGARKKKINKWDAPPPFTWASRAAGFELAFSNTICPHFFLLTLLPPRPVIPPQRFTPSALFPSSPHSVRNLPLTAP